MDNIFYGLSAIIVIAAAVALFMRSIRQPLLIGHILTGIIVGPALLGILDNPKSLSTFGDIGIALLLFIIGLGMNPRVIKEVGRPSTVVAVVEVVLVSLLGWLVAGAVGLNNREAWFIGIGLSINSTIVALKLINDRKEQGRLYGKLTIGASLVDDIWAVIVLIFVASANNGHWLTLGPFLGLALKGLAIGAVMFFVSSKVLPKTQKLIANEQEMLFLFAIAWGLGSAALFAKAGFSLEVGALAAGVSLASLPYAQEIASRLRPLRDFFIIVFFIALGTELSFSGFSNLIVPIIAAVAVVVAIKPILVMATLGALGYTKRTSFKTAIALSQVSEFSIILVILGVQQGLISQHIVNLLTFIALISIAMSTYMVTFGDKLYAKLENYLDLFERKHTKSEERALANNQYILFGYRKGGHEFVRVFRQLKKRFVVVDYDPEVIETLERRRVNYLYGDATDIELLEEAGVSRAELIVSTITDYETTSMLLRFIESKNKAAVVICQADSAEEAAKLYHLGANYVILPHFVGSEKMGEIIKKSGLRKSTLRKIRTRHLKYLEEEFGALDSIADPERKFGHAIVKSVTALAKVGRT